MEEHSTSDLIQLSGNSTNRLKDSSSDPARHLVHRAQLHPEQNGNDQFMIKEESNGAHCSHHQQASKQHSEVVTVVEGSYVSSK